MTTNYTVPGDRALTRALVRAYGVLEEYRHWDEGLRANQFHDREWARGLRERTKGDALRALEQLLEAFDFQA
jgi:hypothetical protein